MYFSHVKVLHTDSTLKSLHVYFQPQYHVKQLFNVHKNMFFVSKHMYVPWSATKNGNGRMDVTFFPVNPSRRASDMFYGRSVRCFGDSTGVEATRQPIGTLLLPQLNFLKTRKSAHGRTSITTSMESHASLTFRSVC